LKIKVAVGVLLLLALVTSAMPVMALRSLSTSKSQNQRNRHHRKQGAEVGNRVRQLRRYNRSVDRALTSFERNEHRNGHKPRLDDASSMTVDPSGGSAALKNVMDASPFRKAAFKPQDEDFTGYGLEIIVIPVYESATEWQGTVIFNKFDTSGGLSGPIRCRRDYYARRHANTAGRGPRNLV
jgi:TolA-binding protein